MVNRRAVVHNLGDDGAGVDRGGRPDPERRIRTLTRRSCSCSPAAAPEARPTSGFSRFSKNSTSPRISSSEPAWAPSSAVSTPPVGRPRKWMSCSPNHGLESRLLGRGPQKRKSFRRKQDDRPILIQTRVHFKGFKPYLPPGILGGQRLELLMDALEAESATADESR